MRNWMVMSLFLVVGVTTAETEPRTALIHIGPDDFKTKTLRQEVVAGHSYLIVQAKARNARVAATLGYCRIRAWYDMQDRVTRKILLLDQDDMTLTTIWFSAFSIKGGKQQAGQMEVTDHSTGQTTVFQLDGYNIFINPSTLI